jgi:hypothetical protein
MRSALVWGALVTLSVVLPIASCGESTQNPSSGGGGESLGGATEQGGSTISGRGGSGDLPVMGESSGGAGGALAGVAGEGATVGLGGAASGSAGMSDDGGSTTSGSAGDVTGGVGGAEPNLPLQCTNGEKDAGEVCVDCGGPCPACELIWKCSDAACEGSPSACVSSGLCPGGPKPAQCLHGTSCDSLNVLSESYTFGVTNGCSPTQDECRFYECKCSCPD